MTCYPSKEDHSSYVEIKLIARDSGPYEKKVIQDDKVYNEEDSEDIIYQLLYNDTVYVMN